MAYDKLVSLQGLISEPTDSNLLVAGAMMDFIKVAKDSINERDAVQRIHQRRRDLYKSRKRGKRDFLPDELVIHFIAYRRNELPEKLRIEWTQWSEIERNGKRNRVLNEFWDEFRRFKRDEQGEKSDFPSFQMNDSRSTELKLLFRSGEVIVFNPQHVAPAVQQWLSEPARKRVPPPVVDLVPDRDALVREKFLRLARTPLMPFLIHQDKS